MAGRVRVGIGGWTFAPWRGPFYPKGLPHKRELAYAATRLAVLEINATYHRQHAPEDFARWAAETPDDFVFTVKASRTCTNRRELSAGGEAVERFLAQGLDRLGSKLGPILWQFMPTKRFDAADFEGFLDLLPGSLGGRPLRHAFEARHESFADPRFFALVRAWGGAAALGVGEGRPAFFDPAAPFAYLRIQTLCAEEPLGLSAEALDGWAARLAALAAGGPLTGVPLAGGPAADAAPPGAPREVFAFLINGFKERAPLAASALLTRLGAQTASGSTS